MNSIFNEADNILTDMQNEWNNMDIGDDDTEFLELTAIIEHFKRIYYKISEAHSAYGGY